MDADRQPHLPKQADQIRGALQRLRQQRGQSRDSSEESNAGPFRDGLAAEDRLVIASFHQQANARAFQAELHRAGLMSTLRSNARKHAVLVDFEDHHRASELYRQFARAHADLRPAVAMRHDWLIFAMLIGASVAGAFAMGATGIHRLTGPLAIVVFSALLGHLGDRVRMRHRESGTLRFSTGDFIVLATLPGLMYYLFYLIPQLISEG